MTSSHHNLDNTDLPDATTIRLQIQGFRGVQPTDPYIESIIVALELQLQKLDMAKTTIGGNSAPSHLSTFDPDFESDREIVLSLAIEDGIHPLQHDILEVSTSFQQTGEEVDSIRDNRQKDELFTRPKLSNLLSTSQWLSGLTQSDLSEQIQANLAACSTACIRKTPLSCSTFRVLQQQKDDA